MTLTIKPSYLKGILYFSDRSAIAEWLSVNASACDLYTANSRFFDIRYSFQETILQKPVEILMAVGIPTTWNVATNGRDSYKNLNQNIVGTSEILSNLQLALVSIFFKPNFYRSPMRI